MKIEFDRTRTSRSEYILGRPRQHIYFYEEDKRTNGVVGYIVGAEGYYSENDFAMLVEIGYRVFLNGRGWLPESMRTLADAKAFAAREAARIA